MNYDELLDKLEGVNRTGDHAMALCPAHGDRNPSLSVDLKDGVIVLYCHAGCTQGDVMEAIGVTGKDLGSSGRTQFDPRTAPVEDVYLYEDENGQPLFEVVRYQKYEDEDGEIQKPFRQRHYDAEGNAVYNLNGVRRVLYRLPKVLQAVKDGTTVYLCEGEKDVHALEAHGKVATCNPMGAGKWNSGYTDALTGAKVIQVVDRDEPGRKHAELVKAALKDKAQAHWLVQAKLGKDAYDHLVENGFKPEEFQQVRHHASLAWRRIDLSDPEYDRPATPPNICGLIYHGVRHALSGPPESAKTLVSLIFGLEHMRGTGEAFALIDFEMGERATRQLLMDLGATMEEISRVFYVTPDGPPEQADLDAMDAAGATLAIIDSAASAYGKSDLDDNKRGDAEKFSKMWIDPLWHLGMTTLLLDHVAKNVESSRFMIGSERKLGTVDVHLGFEPMAPFSRGKHGLVRVSTHKDRPGFLPRPYAADVELSSEPGTHRIGWRFRPTEGLYD